MYLVCRHCNSKPANRSKQLCYCCYRKYGHTYASHSKFGRRGTGHLCLKSSCVPTDTEPGSEERIRVLEGRAARGEPLFHELDQKGTSKIQTAWHNEGVYELDD